MRFIGFLAFIGFSAFFKTQSIREISSTQKTQETHFPDPFSFDRLCLFSKLPFVLHLLRPAQGSVRRRKRVARGNSAGGGTTAGRGTKGQQSRVGKGRRWGFEGGQTPLVRRQPKLGGFARPRALRYEVVTLGKMDSLLEAGSYDSAALRRRGLVRSGAPVKVLGNAVKKKFALTVHAASKGAKKALVDAGGSITIVQ
jgi:large subunit ribosomal protein L15